MKYNNYSSVCNKCFVRGWHTKKSKCTRQYTQACKCCGSRENGKLVTCSGSNILIDYSGIAQKFSSFYGTNVRIKVGFTDINGKIYETKTGTVSMTTGWKPSLMLLLKKNSSGSSYLLSNEDILL